jgi:hypothetical protein
MADVDHQGRRWGASPAGPRDSIPDSRGRRTTGRRQNGSRWPILSSAPARRRLAAPRRGLPSAPDTVGACSIAAMRRRRLPVRGSGVARTAGPRRDQLLQRSGVQSPPARNRNGNA